MRTSDKYSETRNVVNCCMPILERCICLLTWVSPHITHRIDDLAWVSFYEDKMLVKGRVLRKIQWLTKSGCIVGINDLEQSVGIWESSELFYHHLLVLVVDWLLMAMSHGISPIESRQRHQGNSFNGNMKCDVGKDWLFCWNSGGIQIQGVIVFTGNRLESNWSNTTILCPIW